jgi:hypothetical protein
VLWVFFRRNAGAADGDIRRLKAMLHIDSRRDEFLLTFGSRHKPNEIALLTRSMQEILTELAAGVDVPAEDLAESRATESHGGADAERSQSPLIRAFSRAMDRRLTRMRPFIIATAGFGSATEI